MLKDIVKNPEEQSVRGPSEAKHERDGHARRRRHRRHRLYAAMTLRRQQPRAIIMQRSLPVCMPNYLRQFTNVSRKAIRNLHSAPETHPSLPLIGISTTI